MLIKVLLLVSVSTVKLAPPTMRNMAIPAEKDNQENQRWIPIVCGDGQSNQGEVGSGIYQAIIIVNCLCVFAVVLTLMIRMIGSLNNPSDQLSKSSKINVGTMTCNERLKNNENSPLPMAFQHVCYFCNRENVVYLNELYENLSTPKIIHNPYELNQIDIFH